MPFGAALSTRPDTEPALAEVLSVAGDALGGAPDLALLFYSPHHQSALATLADGLRAQLGARWLLGCPGETIVGGDREVEQAPALALWLARWPAPVEITPFHLAIERTSEGDALLGWPDELPDARAGQTLILTLADPFTFPVDAYLSHLNQER